jgi:hypothetical protein
MKHQRAERVKQRLTCELVIGDRRHLGIVVDVSRTGLFVQTSAAPPPGERVRVKLRGPDGDTAELEASVARRYKVPPRLVSIARGGIGLRIESVTQEYLQLIDSVAPAANPSPSKSVDAPSSPRSCAAVSYSVRLKQTPGTRSRTLRIAAASEEEARRTASADVGEGWEILSVEPVGA